MFEEFVVIWRGDLEELEASPFGDSLEMVGVCKMKRRTVQLWLNASVPGQHTKQRQLGNKESLPRTCAGRFDGDEQEAAGPTDVREPAGL